MPLTSRRRWPLPEIGAPARTAIRESTWWFPLRALLAATVVAAVAAAASVVAAATGATSPAQPDRPHSEHSVRMSRYAPSAPDAAVRLALTDRVLHGLPRVLPGSEELAGSTPDGRAARDFLAAIALADSVQATYPMLRAGGVTGAEVARGASDAAEDYGAGSGFASAARTGGAGSAVVSRVDPLAVHAGFRLIRLERRTAPRHASILPLERPD
jgi:hypothetical protein